MQSLLEFMNRDRLKKHKIAKYTPQDKTELAEIIYNIVREHGSWDPDLNDIIDISEISDMSYLFSQSYGLANFCGDISQWDVINVKDMSYMFWNSRFDGDIENWKVNPKRDMTDIFLNSSFKKTHLSGIKNNIIKLCNHY